MQRHRWGVGLALTGLLVGMLVALTFAPSPVISGTAAMAQIGHATAPTLDCWQCHGTHPAMGTVPSADGMLCFDCHAVQ